MLLATLMLSVPIFLHSPASHDPLTVTVDSARRTVVLSAGPFLIAPGAPAGHEGHHGMHDHGDELPLLRFEWPVDGWARGVRLKVVDSAGRELPRRLIHHINVVNFGRRQLFYPAVERMIAIGQETEDIVLPAGVGIPVRRGMEMGVLIAWHNESPEMLEDVSVTLEISYSPTTMMPAPVSVLPVYMDVKYPVAQPADFDLPPGRNTFTADFVMPIDGRLLGIGGHLHDHGTGMALLEIGSGSPRTVVSLATRLAAGGRLESIERKFPGVRGDGIPLKAGMTYRLTATYDNVSGTLIPRGAMVHLVGLFAPARGAEWPPVKPDDPEYARDLAWLRERGGGGVAGHTGHDH